MNIRNDQAHFNYILGESFEAGIVLGGGEVKSVKRGNVDLSRSFAKIVEGEVFLFNTSIPVEGKKDYNPTRPRKLLLHKKQITSIGSKIKAKTLTLVPTKMYNKGRLVKVELALAKSKRNFQKKESIKRKDVQRDIERELKDYKS